MSDSFNEGVRMSRIVVFGGSGYAGQHIVAEAVKRGHEVTSVTRSVPATPVVGAQHVTGSIYDAELLAQLSLDADVFLSSVPSHSGGQQLPSALPHLVEICIKHGVRFGVIGGAGSLLVEEGGLELRVAFADVLPAESMPEINTHAELLQDLRDTPSEFDWFFLSPALAFGAHVPGEHLHVYRIGGDVMLKDAEGNSAISGTDFADAVLDELEHHTHRRARFSVAY